MAITILYEFVEPKCYDLGWYNNFVCSFVVEMELLSVKFGIGVNDLI